ncbi:MAG: siphovirus Gp157 family protein, partial [bacterium]
MTSLFELACASHQIQQQIREIGDNLDLDDPESVNRLETLLLEGENNSLQIGEKANATCWVISNYLAQAEYLREQADRLNKLAEKDEDRAYALQNRLIDIMRRLYPEKSRF